MEERFTRRQMITAAIGLAALHGCGGGKRGGGASVSEPAPPRLDRSPAVAGTDTDRDGVRDDITEYIRRAVPTEAPRAALLQVARGIQASLASTTRDGAIGVATASIAAVAHLHTQGEDTARYLRRVFAYTVNTPERAAAYVRYQRLLANAVLRSSVGAGATRAAGDACAARGYTVAFVNGVMNTDVDAWLSWTLLRLAVGEVHDDQPVRWEYYHNPTDGFVSDLLESAKQKFRELGVTPAIELLWAILAGDDQLLETALGPLNLPPGTADLLVRALRAVVGAAAARVAQIGPNPEPTIAAIVNALTVNLTERQKCLLVAHSQGNFFANAAVARIPQRLRASVGVVHVATPTAALSGPYTTSTKDLVIGPIPTAAPANITLPFTSRDLLGHGFNEVYLHPTMASRARILGHVSQSLSALQTPEQGGSSGFFTVTLTWDGPGDVDLHVVEPDGTHVYYGAKGGHSGYLDVDNVTANGPEHYFASCDAGVLQTGVYKIGINHYARATGRRASISLATQDRIHDPVTLDVGPVRGSSGNSSPISVFSVRVEVDAAGRYRATLISSRGASATIDTYRAPNEPVK